MTNGEKYKTAQERAKAFKKWCEDTNGKNCGCDDCILTDSYSCQFAWLDLEAEEEKPLPCPFCGRNHFHISVSHTDGAVMDCICGYATAKYLDYESMIAAHNRVAKAVRGSEVKR